MGNEPGLIAYYDFDQGIAAGNNSSIITLIDRTSNNYTGTLTGFAKSGSGSNFVTSGISISGNYIVGAPTITGISSSLSVCSGGTANLSVTALGTNLSYQWYKNGSAIAGQTFSTLTLTSGLTTSPGTILAVVSNLGGAVTSTGISLSVGCNNALDFDGVDDRITNTYSAGQVPTGNQDWTFQTWAYYKGGQTGDKWFAWWGTATLADQEVILGINATNNTLKIDRYSPDNRALSTPMPLNTWTHLSYAYTGANRTLKVYVNGALTNTINDYTSDLNISSTGTFELGTFQSSTLFNSNIILDEVRLFNVALSDADINLSKNAIVSSTTPNLALFYDFNQGVAAQNNSSETVLFDRTSNPLNLTLTNFGLNGSSSNWVNTNVTLAGAFNFLAPTITGISPSLTVCSGVVTNLTVTASGTNISYQWFKNGAAIVGQTFSTLTLSSGLTTTSGTILAVVSGSGGSVTSTGINLTIACPSALDYLGLTSTTPSIAAYSLRQLNSAYTGPLARIAIGSNFYDVYPDASGNKSFSLSSPISAPYALYNSVSTGPTGSLLGSIVNGSTNATMAVWYDQSSSGNHAVQSVTANQPNIITSGSIYTYNSRPTP
ncbi:MAG: LamG domain-containing protein, partial [Cytophagales bacterium]|nr:LamG domain-containing protein [Cytophagales bacterium]